MRVNRINLTWLVLGSALSTAILFYVVMYWVNPYIDGGSGLGLLRMQLSFGKLNASLLLQQWGEGAVERFQQWIFVDYVYALSYGIFLASLQAFLAKHIAAKPPGYPFGLYSALLASGLDWLENLMQQAFLSDMNAYPNSFYLLHSLLSSLKWLALLFVSTQLILLTWRRLFTSTPASHKSQDQGDLKPNRP